MKSVILHIILLLLLPAATSRDKPKCSIGCETIRLVNNRIVIEAAVDGVQSAFILGTARKSVVENSVTASPRIENHLIVSESVLLPRADSKTWSNGCPANLQTPVLGIYGSDLLASCNQVISLNFDKLQLCNLATDKAQEMISKENFQLVASRFSNGKIKIALTINWKVQWFTIDSEYDGAFEMTFKENLRFLKEPHTVWDKIASKKCERLYYNKAIWLNGTGYNSSITTSCNSPDDRVGLEFLKSFNWIFDHASKEVFFKKNSIGLNSFMENRDYRIQIINQKIVVSAVNVNSLDVVPGSVVKAVDGVNVSPENVCDIRDILKATLNWRGLTISFE